MDISKKTKIIILITTIIICVAVYFISIAIYKSEKHTINNNELITEEKLYDISNYPNVDSSLITQDLATAFIKNFTGSDTINVDSLNYSNTHSAYEKLINNNVDLIIARSPSKTDLDLAAQRNVDFDLIPIAKDAIVFYVDSENPVDNLTITQIQQIYSGEITNWKEVGGKDEQIIAYQKPTGTDSQNEMLSLVMNNSQVLTPPTESFSEGSIQVNNMISNYKNTSNSIGYSYYTLANIEFQTKDQDFSNSVRLLSINGITPNTESIKYGTYPFITNYYIVINKEDYSNFPSRILANQMQSARGKKVVEDAGFIPVEVKEE